MQSTILSKKAFAAVRSVNQAQPGSVYISNPALDDAVKAAFLLRQPLLLTGDPGTGKTTLGYKLARDLSLLSDGEFYEKPLFFSAKSLSVASDLFYVYDAVSHFKSVNLRPADTDGSQTPPSPSEFIKLEALGIAILAGNRDKLEDDTALLEQLPEKDQARKAHSFVVIIDEIDKAPRDFPNDLLHEIESLSFKIREKDNQEFAKNENSNIFIILTSNAEKPLPDAFLRRCVFHHIDYPSRKMLTDILAAHRIADQAGQPVGDEFIAGCLGLFSGIRELCTDKKPSTAELVNWAVFLADQGADFSKLDADIFRSSLGIIVKSKHDLNQIAEANILTGSYH